MKRLELDKARTALVIVAHPDDETIWMGGAILRNKSIGWTILSACRASDTDRAPKFERVCARYGAEGVICDLEDLDMLDLGEAEKAARLLIGARIGGKKYDCVFTHGANGEYGHPRHIAVHRAVIDLFKSKAFATEALFCFDYKKKNGSLVPAGDESLLLELAPGELAEKKRIVAEMYGYPYGGIDVEYCTNPEAFIRS